MLRLELLTELRDRGRWTALLLVVGWFLLPGPLQRASDWLDDHTPRDQAVVREPTLSKQLPPCTADDVPPVTVEGAWPEWLDWPEPFSDTPDIRIDVHQSVGSPILELDPHLAREGAEVGAVRRCLGRAVRHARRERMAELGIAQDPSRLTATAFGPLPARGVPWVERLTLPSLLLALLGFGLMGTIALEAVPRRRASGLLEQLRSTPTPTSALVTAWLLSMGLIAAAFLALCAAMFIAGAWWAEVPVRLVPMLHVGPLVALTGAASIRSSLAAEDLLAASLRWSVVVVLGVVGLGLAVAMLGSSPVGAALVPLGGSWLAAAGLLGPWAWLADLVALASTVGLVAWSSTLLRNETSSSAGASPALLRQARGNFVPEALLLSGFGMAAAVLTDPSLFGAGLAVSIGLVFGVMMVAPAVAAGPLLGLPRGALLPMGRPTLRDLALLIPVMLGLLGLAPTVFALSAGALPDNPLDELLADQLRTALEEPAVQVALVVGPALGEELLFRGAVQGLLMRSGRVGWAIVGQAALFAVAHALALRLPWTFAVGVVLGVVRWRTGSLWGGMLLHAGINAAAILLAPGADPTLPTLEQALPWLPLGLGLLGLAGLRGPTPQPAAS